MLTKSLIDKILPQVEERIKKLESEHIKKAARYTSISKIELRKNETILGDIYTFSAISNGYIVLFHGGARSWSSCCCKGWYFNWRCKHTYKLTKQIKKVLSEGQTESTKTKNQG